jgi:hypothetical protein
MNNSEASSGAKKGELEAPIVLTPDQIAAVAGGTATLTGTGTKPGGATMGFMSGPPVPIMQSL